VVGEGTNPPLPTPPVPPLPPLLPPALASCPPLLPPEPLVTVLPSGPLVGSAVLPPVPVTSLIPPAPPAPRVPPPPPLPRLSVPPLPALALEPAFAVAPPVPPKLPLPLTPPPFVPPAPWTPPCPPDPPAADSGFNPELPQPLTSTMIDITTPKTHWGAGSLASAREQLLETARILFVISSVDYTKLPVGRVIHLSAQCLVRPTCNRAVPHGVIGVRQPIYWFLRTHPA